MIPGWYSQALTLAHKKAREGSTSETKGYEDIAESTKGIVRPFPLITIPFSLTLE